MHKPPLAITVCELLTPLDGPHAGTWEALHAGQRVGAQTAVPGQYLAGEEALDRSLRLALAVGRRALAQTGSADMMLFCGTSKGPAGVMLAACARLRRGEAVLMEQARQVALGVGAMGAILRERLGLEGGVTSVAACASGMHALHRAAQTLWRGECRRALVVAADASRQPLFEASFARLGVLAPADARGVRRCEPFGKEGAGFFLSEGAVAVVLENADFKSQISNFKFQNAEQEPRNEGRPLAYLEETWIGGDSTGMVAMDEGTVTLRRGLAACMPAGGEGLAFVHAHATGTKHDAFEREAIRAVCGAEVEVFSHKKWLGHTLGAAGLVSVALSALCHREGRSLGGGVVGAGAASLTIAQGFGGHVAVARLRGASP